MEVSDQYTKQAMHQYESESEYVECRSIQTTCLAYTDLNQSYMGKQKQCEEIPSGMANNSRNIVQGSSVLSI